MPRFCRTLIAAAFAACTMAAQAAPITVDVRFSDPVNKPLGGDTVSITAPVNTRAIAGRYQGTASNLVGIDASSFVDSIGGLWAYCYDVFQTIGNGITVKYEVVFDGAAARTLSFLGAVNSVLDPAGTDPHAWLHPTDRHASAAIQLGIWESLYEADGNGWDLGSGAFQASGVDAGTQLALGKFLDAIGAPALDRRYTMLLESDRRQDLITGRNGVPAPGTLVLLLGPAAMLIARRGRGRAQFSR